jgi:hypothetical protein
MSEISSLFLPPNLNFEDFYPDYNSEQNQISLMQKTAKKSNSNNQSDPFPENSVTESHWDINSEPPLSFWEDISTSDNTSANLAAAPANHPVTRGTSTFIPHLSRSETEFIGDLEPSWKELGVGAESGDIFAMLGADDGQGSFPQKNNIHNPFERLDLSQESIELIIR